MGQGDGVGRTSAAVGSGAGGTQLKSRSSLLPSSPLIAREGPTPRTPAASPLPTSYGRRAPRGAGSLARPALRLPGPLTGPALAAPAVPGPAPLPCGSSLGGSPGASGARAFRGGGGASSRRAPGALLPWSRHPEPPRLCRERRSGALAAARRPSAIPKPSAAAVSGPWGEISFSCVVTHHYLPGNRESSACLFYVLCALRSERALTLQPLSKHPTPI